MAAVKGGDKMDRVLAGIEKKATSASLVRVGFLERATYPDGTPVAMIAAIQNWGAPARNIPPRPFFSNMIAQKRAEWPKAMGNLLKANGMDAKGTLEQTGQAITGQLRQSITDTNSPPLSPVTLRRRGVASNMIYDPKNPSTFGAKPLVDTGHMLQSADYDVKS